jgi:hypothetical protein
MKSNEKISNYSVKEKLGKGSYGEVYRVEEKSKFEYLFIEQFIYDNLKYLY